MIALFLYVRSGPREITWAQITSKTIKIGQTYRNANKAFALHHFQLNAGKLHWIREKTCNIKSKTKAAMSGWLLGEEGIFFLATWQPHVWGHRKELLLSKEQARALSFSLWCLWLFYGQLMPMTTKWNRESTVLAGRRQVSGPFTQKVFESPVLDFVAQSSSYHTVVWVSVRPGLPNF